MPDSGPIFIGIDPTAGDRPITYAALDGGLRVLALGEGKLDDVLAFVVQHTAALAAIDAPQSLNAGLMSDPQVRKQLGLPPRTKTWVGFKVCEFELRRRGILLYNTPEKVSDAPRWMQAGFRLWKRLRKAGFVLHHRVGAGGPRVMLEVNPHACFTVLLEGIPFKKDTLEGRLQRQLLLYREGVRVPDAMRVLEEITRHRLLTGQLHLDGLYSHDQLDALVSAYTAFLAARHPDRVTLVGDAREGQIVAPTAELLDHYA